MCLSQCISGLSVRAQSHHRVKYTSSDHVKVNLYVSIDPKSDLPLPTFVFQNTPLTLFISPQNSKELCCIQIRVHNMQPGI